MTIPETIPTPPSEASANYTYTDVRAGTGYQTYFLGANTISGSISYELSESAFYSLPFETSGGLFAPGVGGVYYPIQSIDFDLTQFNRPQIIKGEALIEFTFRFKSLNTVHGRVRFDIIVSKVSGGTPVEIGSGESKIYDTAFDGIVGDHEIEKTIALPVTLPRTHFKKGDILRVTIKDLIRAYAGGGGGKYYIGIAHDPKNRSGSFVYRTDNFNPPDGLIGYTSINTVKIPYELDL